MRRAFRTTVGVVAAGLVAAGLLASCTSSSSDGPTVAVTATVARTTTSTRVASTTTTTVPATPIVPRELWTVAARAGLLELWNGSGPPRPELTVGVPAGSVAGVDLPALAGRTGMFQQVRFRADIDGIRVRELTVGLHTDAATAAAYVAARAALFEPVENATAASSTVKGAVGHLYRPATDGPLYVRVSVAHGPLDLTVDVRQVKTDPVLEPATLAAADATLTSAMAAADVRIGTCGSPCRGANGPLPTSAVHRLQPAECTAAAPVGADFLPPAEDATTVPCDQPHTAHAVTTVPTGDDTAIYDAITTATPADHPFHRIADACQKAVVQWMTAARYTPTPGGSFGLRIQLPTRAAFTAGDRAAVCVLTPADLVREQLAPVPAG